MGFKVPRKQRQFEDPSEVIQGRAVAATAGLEAEAALGQAIVGAGVDLGTIISRNRRAKQRMARERMINRSTEAANFVRQDMVEFKVKELSTPGLKTEDNLERLANFYKERIQERTADLSENEKLLVDQELGADRIKDQTDFAKHQQEQLKGVVFSNIEQSRDRAVQEAANDPTLSTIEAKFKSFNLTVLKAKVAGSIGEEEAEDMRKEGEIMIARSAIVSATLLNPELAQIILEDKLIKDILPAETVKALETDIRKQTKLQKDEAAAERDATAQTFLSDLTDLAEDGAATVTQAQASPAWNVLTPEEKKNALSIISKGSPFNKSDDVIRATLTTEVIANPTPQTRQKLLDAHANGLSTVHFKELFKQLETTLGQDETPQEAAIARGYTELNDAKTNNVFDSNEAKNSNEWARATQAFGKFVKDNPDAKPEDYPNFTEQLLQEVKRGFLGSAWDLIRHPILFKRELGASEDEPKSRRLAIGALTTAGQEITEANIIDAINQLEDAGEL